MREQYKTITGFFLLAALLFVITACNLESVKVGSLKTESESIDLGSAESLSAEIEMGVGRLEIDSGPAGQIEAIITSNVDQWKPELSYEISAGQGELTMQQPPSENSFPFDLGDIRYEWLLRFDEGIPLDLDISIGAGEGELELDNLNLSGFSFQGGAGEVEIDLSGSTASKVDIRMGAGDLTLDLSGKWAQDMSADIHGGIGRAILLLPQEPGLRIKVQGGLGEINAPGLNNNGDTYTNDAYGTAEVNLDIEIEGGIGEITLITPE